MKTLSLCFVGLSCLLLGAPSSQDCSSGNLQKRISIVESDLQTKFHVPIRLHRVEEIEDELFAPKPGSRDADPPIFLYQIQSRRWYLKEGQLLLVGGTGGAGFDSYVALSRDGDQLYRLGGFEGAEDNFTRLVEEAGLSKLPDAASAAESRALVCATLLYERPSNLWIMDENKLELDLARHFLDQGEEHFVTVAHAWLTKYRSSHPGFKVGATITHSGVGGSESGARVITLPYLWAPLEGGDSPRIRELRIEVRLDGSCHLLERADK